MVGVVIVVVVVGTALALTVQLPISRQPAVLAGCVLPLYLKHSLPLPSAENCMRTPTRVLTGPVPATVVRNCSPPPITTCSMSERHNHCTHACASGQGGIARVGAVGGAVDQLDLVVAGQVHAREDDVRRRRDAHVEGHLTVRQAAGSCRWSTVPLTTAVMRGRRTTVRLNVCTICDK